MGGVGELRICGVLEQAPAVKAATCRRTPELQGYLLLARGAGVVFAGVGYIGSSIAKSRTVRDWSCENSRYQLRVRLAMASYDRRVLDRSYGNPRYRRQIYEPRSATSKVWCGMADIALLSLHGDSRNTERGTKRYTQRCA